MKNCACMAECFQIFIVITCLSHIRFSPANYNVCERCRTILIRNKQNAAQSQRPSTFISEHFRTHRSHLTNSNVQRTLIGKLAISVLRKHHSLTVLDAYPVNMMADLSNILTSVHRLNKHNPLSLLCLY